ncbi:hypothetical protein AQJ30_35760 [Streptomyces longwoodensis]|uniref:Uncharacterized protein n=1 Tax=Streptomyces longwoodensis TaxID=68231 RepID=A0A101QND9_9ACTN|nr:hypothetical protein [Streptomyces longwoodensis]KUN33038.1 hypothetical protein AQJ30_35760 [Streptomyces longwoodensis]
MTAREPVVPEAEWGKFLRDTEEAIRRSAPREPSARERASGAGVDGAGVDGAGVGDRGVGDAGVDDAVGEVWCPDESPAAPAWRQLDPGARVRRLVRFLGTLTLLLVLLVLFRHAQPGVPSP